MKQIRYLLLIIFFNVINADFLFAQTGKLKGTVTDSLDKPIDAAAVILSRTNFSGLTNARGNYLIENIKPGTYEIVVTIMGYGPAFQKITIKENETAELNFKLYQKTKQLGEVTVNGVRTISGMGHLDEVHDGVIYSGKKNEVLILDSIDGNTAQNNPRQVLGRVPGSNYSETEGSGFPSNGIGFRGLSPVQSIETNTRQNGYNVTADLYGYPESYYLPPLEAIERIEVIRGASSLQFGPQFGGVINYITKDGPSDKPFELTTQQTGGSYGLFNTFESVGGTYKKWNYFTYVQYKQVDGWRPNSSVKNLLGFAKVQYNASEKFKVGLEYSYLRNTIKMPGGLTDQEFEQDPGQSTRARNWLRSPWNILALTAQYKASEKTIIQFKSVLNVSARDLVWRNEDGGPQAPDTIDRATGNYVPREVEHEGFVSVTNELRTLTNYKIKDVVQTLAVGIRYFQGQMKRQEGGPGSTGSDFDMNLYGGAYENDLDFTTTNVAAFVENTFRFGKSLSITPGYRYEYLSSSVKGYITDDDSAKILNVDRSHNRTISLAGLGLQYKTSGTTNIYANISQAYRPTDYSNQTPIGVSSKIDPNLKDASGYNADLGWRGTVKNYLNFDVGLFYMAYNNRIGIESLRDATHIASDSVYTYRTNVANSVHQGVETYIEVNPVKMFTDNSKIGTISFFNSFAYIDAKYVNGQFNGNAVEFAPKTINRFGITYSIKNFSTTFLISNTAKSFSDADNTVNSPNATIGVIPAYQVMDWSATIKYKRYNLKFGVNNLADAKYFTLRTDEYPGPGIIPSMGRTFYVGIGAKF